MKTMTGKLGGVVLILVLLINTTFGQVGRIAGILLDEAGIPMAGYNVLIVGTALGGATDVNGNYNIPNVPVGTYTVRYSFVPGVNVQGVPVVDGRRTILWPTTNTNNTGPGSLRDALVAADSLGDNVFLHFILRGPSYSITPTSPLPFITHSLVLDGTTAAGGYVELDGTSAGTGTSGLTIAASGCVIRGLVINRFDSDGIDIISGGGNVIEGNKIGTDATGMSAPGNHTNGILVRTAGNTIGGPTPAQRNIISGNVIGLILQGVNADNNIIQGNYIGTNVTGTAALQNSWDGINITGDWGSASGNIVGGTAPGEGNLISGNGGSGVIIHNKAAGTKVTGNRVGTNAAGTSSLQNAIGVHILKASGNSIGGNSSGEGNLISGNGSGVLIYGEPTDSANANVVQGNKIGTNLAGTSAVGNSDNGVWLGACSADNIVGGWEANARNIISGNAAGIKLSDGAKENHILGNYIGTDVSGAYAVPNSIWGIYLDNAPGNLIGGTMSGGLGLVGTGNLISGNLSDGISINGMGSRDNIVQANLIGTNAAGAAALGNRYSGVAVFDAPSNIIGGNDPAERNIISGNTDGLSFHGTGARNNQVLGNYIGTDVTGTLSLATAGSF